MTEEEREKFYDDEIAPALLDIMRKCNAVGMPFQAHVEFNPGLIGSSADMPARAERSLPMDWAYVAARCGGNADMLIGPSIARRGNVGMAACILCSLASR